MQMTPSTQANSSNVRVVTLLVLLVSAMTGLSFAAVPLYRLFCQVTGYGGTTQRAAEAPDTVIDRFVTVRLDANVAPGLAWAFQPETREIRLKIGENKLGFYRVANLSQQVTKGTATFNVTPEIVGSYFSKIECFCFQEQSLEAGQTAELPVSFFIDPAILDDKDAKSVTEITLSYTFFPLTKNADAGAAQGSLDLSGKGG
jgi:cytochrome c oxidase assembly protein subunit 11